MTPGSISGYPTMLPRIYPRDWQITSSLNNSTKTRRLSRPRALQIETSRTLYLLCSGLSYFHIQHEFVPGAFTITPTQLPDANQPPKRSWVFVLQHNHMIWNYDKWYVRSTSVVCRSCNGGMQIWLSFCKFSDTLFLAKPHYIGLHCQQ